jgi:hypothetical protein
VGTIKPSPAMVVASVALFVALAGSATAAKLITGKSIRNNSIASADVRNNSMSSIDIKNRSLLAKDFRRGQLRRGATGSTGATGAPGRPGRDGFGVLSYPGDGVVLSNGDEGGFLDANCPAGQYPTGGDAYVFEDTVDGNLRPDLLQASLFSLGNDDRPLGWRAFVPDPVNTGGPDVILVVDAICANAATPPPPITAQGKLRLGKGGTELK